MENYMLGVFFLNMETRKAQLRTLYEELSLD